MHKEIDIKSLKDNILKLIDNDWGLIVVKNNLKNKINNNSNNSLSTDHNKSNVNLMTASWIIFGILWNKPVSFIFVRPTRYTYKLIENENYFSICFFNENYKKDKNNGD